jgi:hypothetical protein
MKIFKFVVAISLLIALIGCSTPGATAPTANPQEVEATMSIMRTQAYESAAQIFTQTAAARPSDTPVPTETQAPPTRTPTEPPTPTNTFPPLPTWTATRIPPTATSIFTSTPIGPVATATNSALQCQIKSQSPALGASMSPNNDFDMHWVVKNTGTAAWNSDNVDYKYISGTKFQKYADGFDFPKTVNPGEEIDLAVDMKAPGTTGAYSATWAIVQSGQTICTLKIDLQIK